MEQKDLRDYLHEIALTATQHPPIRMKRQDRTHIAKLCAQFGLKKGAEVGVAAGKFSEVLCQNIPDIELLLVDNWRPSDNRQSKMTGRIHAEHRLKLAEERLKNYNVKFLRGNSMDIVQQFPYGSLDFVYIDAAHDFDNVMRDIIEWARRVRKGGLVAGHDYFHFIDAGVVEAVDAYVKCHKIQDVFLTNEIEASWYFAKN